MLPGVGIFGSDPITKILIQLLRHFEFEIHAIWTNHYEIESSMLSLAAAGNAADESSQTTAASAAKSPIKLITTSIDNVLLNKNVNLVFVCCQPNLHAQISIKALGIGKNVICVHPTCKNLDDIEHMINSAYYYPSLFSSISYGGLKYLNEFKLIKQSLYLVGDVKLCNIVINCQNIALLRRNNNSNNNSSSSSSSSRQRQASLSSLIDNIAFIASSSASACSLNWLSDRDLGAGVLNRFGAAMISFCLNMFDNTRVNRVYGCLRTLCEDINLPTPTPMPTPQTPPPASQPPKTTSPQPPSAPLIFSNKSKMAPSPPTAAGTSGAQQQHQPRSKSINNKNSNKNIRKITADDYCTFQMNLEPLSILVNVTINSVANCKYAQEISICGTSGILTWTNNSNNSNHSKVVFKRTSCCNSNSSLQQQQQQHHQLSTSTSSSLDCNNNNVSLSDSVESLENSNSGGGGGELILGSAETELHSNEPVDQTAENFLNTYRNVERKHPELPLIFIRGLYYYLAGVKQEFTAAAAQTKAAASPYAKKQPNNKSAVAAAAASSLENFEHTRLVQLIVKHIQLSSELNRWITINYS